MVTLEEVKGLKYQELKDELKRLGLDASGLKAVLAARLTQALEKASEAPKEEAKAASEPEAPAEPKAAPAATKEIPKTTTGGKPLITFTPSDSTAVKPEATQSAGQAAKPASEASEIPAGTALSEADRRKQRAARFGIPASLEDKKAARAERFGVAETEKSKAKAGVSNGIVAPLSDAEKAAFEEKKNERAKRFNLTTTLSKEEIEKQKKARLERFGSTVDKDDSAELQAKLAARAQRFALGSNATTAAKPGIPKPEEAKKPLDPEAEAKRKAREIKFTAK